MDEQEIQRRIVELQVEHGDLDGDVAGGDQLIEQIGTQAGHCVEKLHAKLRVLDEKRQTRGPTDIGHSQQAMLRAGTCPQPGELNKGVQVGGRRERRRAW